MFSDGRLVHPEKSCELLSQTEPRTLPLGGDKYHQVGQSCREQSWRPWAWWGSIEENGREVTGVLDNRSPRAPTPEVTVLGKEVGIFLEPARPGKGLHI
jgi:hypothetical protein